MNSIYLAIGNLKNMESLTCKNSIRELSAEQYARVKIYHKCLSFNN